MQDSYNVAVTRRTYLLRVLPWRIWTRHGVSWWFHLSLTNSHVKKLPASSNHSSVHVRLQKDEVLKLKVGWIISLISLAWIKRLSYATSIWCGRMACWPIVATCKHGLPRVRQWGTLMPCCDWNSLCCSSSQKSHVGSVIRNWMRKLKRQAWIILMSNA